MEEKSVQEMITLGPTTQATLALLNFNMKSWNSTFNSQGLKVIIIVVQVGAMTIYVDQYWKHSKRGKTRWNSIYHQNWWKN